MKCVGDFDVKKEVEVGFEKFIYVGVDFIFVNCKNDGGCVIYEKLYYIIDYKF